jgi:hypothetical protein
MAHRVLAPIGVPDTGHSPASGPAPLATETSPAPSATATAATPKAAGLVLTATYPQVPAGGTDVLAGRLPTAGRRVSVELLAADPADPDAWHRVAVAATDRSGDVTFTERHLTRNTEFQLAGPGTTVSAPVLVTVVPQLTVATSGGTVPGTDIITVSARYADPGNVVILQVFTNGSWHGIARQQLDRGHRTSFTVASGQRRVYRVLLPASTGHASAVSIPVSWT